MNNQRINICKSSRIMAIHTARMKEEWVSNVHILKPQLTGLALRECLHHNRIGSKYWNVNVLHKGYIIC